MKKLLFLILYSYFVSFAFCAVHDGIALAFAYKSPAHIYERAYQLVKWYYYNREALGPGRIAKFVLIIVSTYWLQGYICSINWSKARSKILKAAIVLLTKNPAETMSDLFYRLGKGRTEEDEEDNSIDFGSDDEALMKSIRLHVNEVILDVLKNEYGELTCSEIISKIKKIAIVKIDYELEVIIRRAVLEHMDRIKQEKS